MKTLLLIVAFIVFAPLFIAILANRSSKSNDNLPLSIIMIGFMALLLVFIVSFGKEPPKKKPVKKTSSSYAQPTNCDCNATCINDDPSICEHEITEKVIISEEQLCDPSLELSE